MSLQSLEGTSMTVPEGAAFIRPSTCLMARLDCDLTEFEYLRAMSETDFERVFFGDEVTGTER